MAGSKARHVHFCIRLVLSLVLGLEQMYIVLKKGWCYVKSGYLTVQNINVATKILRQ